MDLGSEHIALSLNANLGLMQQMILGVRQYLDRTPDWTPRIVLGLDESALRVREGGRLAGAILQQSGGRSADLPARVSGPVVLISNRREAGDLRRVHSDDRAVGRLGARYLLDRAFRRLVFIHRPGHAYSEDRREGFLAEARAADASVEVRETRENEGELERVGSALAAARAPLGVMVANDLLARQMLVHAPRLVSQVPDPVVVLGVDDDAIQRAASPVPLSSVRLAGERIGYLAAERLHRCLRGLPDDDRPWLVPPSHVVTRRSTDGFAVDDPAVARALRLIRDRVGDLGGVDDLLHQTGGSRRWLERRFRRALGRTPAEEIARVRLARARELILATDLPLQEISGLVGLSEPRMLSLLFRRLTGESPSAFRARSAGG